MAAPKSSSRPGKNANEPQPKRRQEGHDKGPDYPPHESRTLQPIGDKSEKTAGANVMAQQILDLATSNACIKTMGPAKCS